MANDNVLYHSLHWIAHFHALGCRCLPVTLLIQPPQAAIGSDPEGAVGALRKRTNKFIGQPTDLTIDLAAVCKPAKLGCRVRCY
jgi:hypothetical protein